MRHAFLLITCLIATPTLARDNDDPTESAPSDTVGQSSWHPWTDPGYAGPDRAPMAFGVPPNALGHVIQYRITEITQLAYQESSGDELSVRLRAMLTEDDFDREASKCFEWDPSGRCLAFPFMAKNMTIGAPVYPGGRSRIHLTDVDPTAAIRFDVTAWENDDATNDCRLGQRSRNRCVTYNSGDDTVGTTQVGTFSVDDLMEGAVIREVFLGTSTQWVRVKLRIELKDGVPLARCDDGVCFRFPGTRSAFHAPWEGTYTGPWFPDLDTHHSEELADGPLGCENFIGENTGISGGCYDGHAGTDFMLKDSWDAMDAGRVVVAAARGEVVEVVDGQYDRCRATALEVIESVQFWKDADPHWLVDCGEDAYGNDRPLKSNYVKIRTDAANGAVYQHRYYHLKADSIRVRAGDWVECGTVIGEVGSSGMSSAPHLHFEVQRWVDLPNNDWAPVDPNYWQGGYHGNEPLLGTNAPRSRSMWTFPTIPSELPRGQCQMPYDPSTLDFYEHPTGF